MIKWVTPSLAVCADSDMPERFNADECVKAVDWILAGGDAYVESDEVAVAILVLMGLSEIEAMSQVTWANTGVLIA